MSSFDNDPFPGGDPLSGGEADGSSESSLVSTRHFDAPGSDTSTIIHMLQDILAEQREIKAQHRELKVFYFPLSNSTDDWCACYFFMFICEILFFDSAVHST